MGKDYQEIDERITTWIARQHMFFVATAPLDGEGLINCSPKGLDAFRVLEPRKIAYADTGGSGIETVAHLKENGRIVIMFCAFDGPPKIFRFYGRGRSVEPHHEEFGTFVTEFPDLPAVRNVIVVDVERIRDSCGYGVPNYTFSNQRDSLNNYFENQSDDDILRYRLERNERSLEGLNGLDADPIRDQLSSDRS